MPIDRHPHQSSATSAAQQRHIEHGQALPQWWGTTCPVENQLVGVCSDEYWAQKNQNMQQTKPSNKNEDTIHMKYETSKSALAYVKPSWQKMIHIRMIMQQIFQWHAAYGCIRDALYMWHFIWNWNSFCSLVTPFGPESPSPSILTRNFRACPVVSRKSMGSSSGWISSANKFSGIVF